MRRQRSKRSSAAVSISLGVGSSCSRACGVGVVICYASVRCCTLAGRRSSPGDVVAQPVLAVVSVLGKDQKGVVAQFATYMAERGINIEDIEQRVVRGFFVMDMLVDLKDLQIDLSELITGLLE